MKVTMITVLILTSVDKDLGDLEIVHENHSTGPIQD